MVNISEPTINLVNWTMPKMLTGMNQKVRERVFGRVEYQSKDNSPHRGIVGT